MIVEKRQTDKLKQKKTVFIITLGYQNKLVANNKYNIFDIDIPCKICMFTIVYSLTTRKKTY